AVRLDDDLVVGSVIGRHGVSGRDTRIRLEHNVGVVESRARRGGGHSDGRAVGERDHVGSGHGGSSRVAVERERYLGPVEGGAGRGAGDWQGRTVGDRDRIRGGGGRGGRRAIGGEHDVGIERLARRRGCYAHRRGVGEGQGPRGRHGRGRGGDVIGNLGLARS